MAQASLQSAIEQAKTGELDSLQHIVDDSLTINVGDITNANAVAIGRDIELIVNQYQTNLSEEMIIWLEDFRTQIDEQLTAPAAPPRNETRDQKNHRLMLEKVREAWVEGVLKPAKEENAWIHLPAELRPKTAQPDLIRSLSLEAESDSEGIVLDSTKDIVNAFRLRSARAMLILGEPGSGKTITLLELADELIKEAQREPDRPIPVVLNLSSWAEKHPEYLEDWIIERLNTDYGVGKGLGKRWVEDRGLLLLFDGLDEVAEEQRNACVEAINAFWQRFKFGRNGIVVCSRIKEYAALTTELNLTNAIVLSPLSAQTTLSYIERLGSDWQGLRQALDQDTELLKMARSPLLLNIMAVAYREKSGVEILSMSHDRNNDLISTYVELRLERGEREDSFRHSETQRWLAWLAHRMTLNSQSVFHLEDIQPDWLGPAVYNRLRLFLAVFGGLLFGSVLMCLPVIFDLFLADIVQMGLLILPLSWLLSLVVIEFRDNKGDENAKAFVKLILRTLPILVLVSIIFLILRGRPVVNVIPRHPLFIRHGFGAALLVGIPAALMAVVALLRRPLFVNPVEQFDIDQGRIGQAGLYGLLAGMFTGLLSASVLWIVYAFGEAIFAQVTRNSAIVVTAYFMGAGAILVGFTTVISVGLQGNQLKSRSQPGQGIKDSFGSGYRVGCLGALLVGLIPWLIFPTAYYGLAVLILGDQGISLLDFLVASVLTYGIPLGLVFGLILGLAFGASAALLHFFTRHLLWQQGHLPRPLIRFLQYTSRQQLTRQVGGGFIFRHRLLQDYFASLYTPGDKTPPL